MSRATVHVPPAAIVPPENVNEPAFATGAKVGAPQPRVKGFGVPATLIAPGEVGKVSPKATPLMASFGFGLVIVKVNREMPPARIGAGAKAFDSDGGSTAVSGAAPTVVVFVPPSVVARNPLVFVCGPAVMLVTLTLTVHEPLAGIVAPAGDPNVRFVAAALGAQVAPPVQV